MEEIKGKFGTAKIFCNEVPDNVAEQVKSIMVSPVSKGKKVRIMPDNHFGAAGPIGLTMELGSKVIPNLIGVDIGCGVSCTSIDGLNNLDATTFERLDKFIRERTPVGFNIHQNLDKVLERNNLVGLLKKIEKVAKEIGQEDSIKRYKNSIGTLGGGNHFIEIVKDKNNEHYLVVHTGSRKFGKDICDYHQKIAEDTCKDAEKGLEYLDGKAAKKYFDHMKIAQEYAETSRSLIYSTIIFEFFNRNGMQTFSSVHNYIDFEDNILRKGAISAHKLEKVIIPLNMGLGVLVGYGRGKTDWNSSAPHGLGRNFSRTQAKKTLAMEEFKEDTKDIWSSCIDEKRLDESPRAYKDADIVIKELSGNISDIEIWKSVYNIKG